MLEINAAFGQEGQNLGLVGRTGENASRRIVFDCEAVLGEFPDAGIVCALRRACDAEAYAKELTAEGKKRLLTLSAADVAAPGSLMIELRAVEADAIRKSAVYVGRIERGLSGQGDAPGNPVADTINNLEARAKEASAAAAAAQAVANEVQAKLEAGDFKGDPGKDGSDATVTAENIQSALGYAPVTPSALAEKQDALTDADRQSITKTGMTTGPAWTAAQQAAARDRMGIDKPYELIEEIAVDEDNVTLVERDLDITRMYIMIIGVSGHSGTCALATSFNAGNSFTAYWSLAHVAAQYEVVVEHGIANGYCKFSTTSISSTPTLMGINLNAMKAIFSAATKPSRITHLKISGPIPNGTKFKIYGVRA